MRLGGPIFDDKSDPGRWAAAHRALGYRAAYCPLKPEASDDTARAFSAAARAADLVIAEVGAWSNPLHPDPAKAAQALELCTRSLDLAERIGARCCVNISGSRGEQWDGPHPANLTEETFERIVDYVRAIIDAVKPRRAFYTLETMPWMYPDSPESYARLIAAIDRPQLGVHLDPVNLINCPSRYFENASLIRACVAQLGAHIKSVHLKDIVIGDKLMVHLDEVRPGLGMLDYGVLLRELSTLDGDLPVMLEHLPNSAEYAEAARYVRSRAAEAGVTL